MSTPELSHLDERGNARMVDVGHKEDTQREAVAQGEIVMAPKTLALIVSGKARKGDVLTVAKVAAIQAAKQTSSLIPMCHPIPIVGIDIELEPDPKLPGVRLVARVRSNGKTGVEMEALTAVTVGLLTVYDMAKAADRGMRIHNVCLLEKRGGKSGVWTRDETTPPG